MKVTKTGRHFSGVLMDIFFFAFACAAAMGIDIIPGRVNVLLLVFLYFIYLYLLRYVYNNNIGGKGRPVLEQAGIRLQEPFRSIVKIISIVVMMFFPLFFLTMCWLALTPEVSFDNYIFLPPLIIWPDLGIGYVSLMVFLNSDREDGEATSHPWLFPELPDRTVRILVSFILPVLAIVAGSSISGVISRLTLYTEEPAALLFITLTAFVPLRYLVLRTTGVSLLSLISFIFSVLLMTAAYLSRAYIPGYIF